ncbi:MAG: hypothetical protein K2N70_00040 [Helicobacter sp.]|nr:hypothetical protein [Helicobacter sp.]
MWLRTDYAMLHSASSMLCLWLEHRRCALWLGRLYDEQWQTLEVRF